MEFPKWKYHPVKQPVIVRTAMEESNLGPEWCDSPAEFGVETSPGQYPDADISMRKPRLVSAMAVIPAVEEGESEAPMPLRKKPGRKPRLAQVPSPNPGGDVA